METHVWHGLAAPKTLPKPLKTLVREMLLLADRITAVQVAVAALPHTSFENYGSSSLGGISLSALADSLPSGQQPPCADAEQSVRYVISVLMQPLHESHIRQLQLIDAVAHAAKQGLLEPCVEAQQHLQHLTHQLEWERVESNSLVYVRKQLHHDVIHVHGLAAGNHMLPSARLDVGNRPMHQSSLSHNTNVHELVRRVSVAMSSDGVLPVLDVGKGGHNAHVHDGDGGRGDVAEHVSRWWWVHAGEHYCQLLAFQYSFDAVVTGMLAVAGTTLVM